MSAVPCLMFLDLPPPRTQTSVTHQDASQQWPSSARAASLAAVHAALQSAMLGTQSGRKEAAAWLRDAVAALPVSPSAAGLALFHHVLLQVKTPVDDSRYTGATRSPYNQSDTREWQPSSAARRSFAAALPTRDRPRGAEAAARALLALACERQGWRSAPGCEMGYMDRAVINTMHPIRVVTPGCQIGSPPPPPPPVTWDHTGCHQLSVFVTAR
jgi:hypothetical protein